MCDLCSMGKEKDDAIARHLSIAQNLIDLANMYRGLARGTINPHKEEFNNVEMRARRVIRTLVDDWM